MAHPASGWALADDPIGGLRPLDLEQPGPRRQRALVEADVGQALAGRRPALGGLDERRILRGRSTGRSSWSATSSRHAFELRAIARARIERVDARKLGEQGIDVAVIDVLEERAFLGPTPGVLVGS